MKYLKKHRNILLRLIDVFVVIFSYYITEVILTNNIVLETRLFDFGGEII